MALFTEHTDEAGAPDREPAARARWGRGWVFLMVALMLGLVLGAVPSPYVIEQPGPVFNTLGSTEHDGKKVPLISIPDRKTYPTAGSLDLLTVSAIGNRDEHPNWFQVARAWFDSSKAVLPVDQVYPGQETTEQRNQVNQELMVNSQQDAIAAALTSLDVAYTATLTIASVTEGSPSEGQLKDGDVIASLNGADVSNIDALRSAIAANGTSKPATVGVIRHGKPLSVEVTPTSLNGTPVLGIMVGTKYDFPFEVKIELDNVGGPSAGMMFALGIIDKLTPGELNGGQAVAGTGTIDAAGTVGPIGGIRQKMYGALNAGAKWFLAPKSNCDEVTGHIPGGLSVFSVSTLDDALAALKGISDGDTSGLATCSTGG